MRDADRELVALSARQHGVFTRRQAQTAGLSRSAVSRRINVGAFEVVGSTTLRFAGARLSWSGALAAGLLDLGPGALVSEFAAAQLLGLDGFDADAVGFLVPRASRKRTTVGRVSSSTDIRRLDHVVVAGFPCTSGTRTVIEILRLGTIDEAGRALDSACRRRLTAHSVVRRRLDQLGRQGRPGVAAFQELTRVGAVESWLERRFVDLLCRGGIPAPALQQRHVLDGVGIARVDFAYPMWGIVVEVGGRRGYLSLEERQRQERRRNALQLEGKTIYFFTHDDVVHDAPYVVGIVAAALGIAPGGVGTSNTA